MNEEEKKAIKVLERYKQECIEEYKGELDDKDNIDEQHVSYLHQQIEATYTVLNLVTNLQKENEEYKYLYQKALDNTVSADKENIQLKKQIEALKEEVREESNQKLEDYYNEG